MWIVCNFFTFAFIEELQKNCNKICHLYLNLLPHSLGKFECLTVQLYSKASQLRSNASSFNYNKYLPEMLSSRSYVYVD